MLTGACGGIGEQIASYLSAHGASLILVGRNQEKLDHLCSQLLGEPKTVCADLNSDEGLELIQRTVEANPDIDILINAAGVNDFSLLTQQDPALIQTMINTNLTAPILLCRLLLPQLKCRPKAIILNIGSTLGSIGFPGYASYCASKFGLRGFTEALRRELLNTNVTVHFLAPRATRTAMNGSAANALNESLRTPSDEPTVVAQAVVSQLMRTAGCDQYLGWRERLFVKINGVLPKLVTQNIAKQLATIHHFATHSFN